MKTIKRNNEIKRVSDKEGICTLLSLDGSTVLKTYERR